MRVHVVYCPFCTFAFPVMLHREMNNIEVTAQTNAARGIVEMEVRTVTRVAHRCVALVETATITKVPE